MDRMEAKIDLLFSVMANDFLGKQALQVYHSISDNMKEGDEDNESIKEVLKKSLESYKHHNDMVNDSISYYYELFGEESNESLVEMLKEKGIYKEQEKTPKPATEVKTKTKRKSIKD